MEELRNCLAGLSAHKAQLLTDAGLPADYLEPVYECPDCKDTGYVDGQKCHCFRQAMITLLYEQSNIHEMLRTENFDSLSYEYYEGDDLSRFRNAVKICHNFIENLIYCLRILLVTKTEKSSVKLMLTYTSVTFSLSMIWGRN